MLKLSPLSSCQYVSTIPEKTACYRPFKNGHFVRACMEKMMHNQYKENGVRNIYSNYNQMGAYVECSPNQFKKLYLIDLSSTKFRRFRKNAGHFCISILPEYCSSALTAHAYKMVITTVSVIHKSLSICVRH